MVGFAIHLEHGVRATCPLLSPGKSVLEFSSILGDGPLILKDVHAGGWQPGLLNSLLNEDAEVDLQVSWHKYADAKFANGSIVSPGARHLRLQEALRLLRLGESMRGVPAYIRQADLATQPKLGALLPITRAMTYAGERLHKIGMWLGDSSMLSTLHHDDYHNILFLLAGRKRVLLFPTTVSSDLDLRTYAEERWMYDESLQKLSDAPEPSGRMIDNFYHLDVFSNDPAFAAQQKRVAGYGMICELSAGDALYIPHPWAHAVISTNEPDDGFGLNLAVNVWWATDEFHQRMLMWRYGCTALAVALFVLSFKPGLLGSSRESSDDRGTADSKSEVGERQRAESSRVAKGSRGAKSKTKTG